MPSQPGGNVALEKPETGPQYHCTVQKGQSKGHKTCLQGECQHRQELQPHRGPAHSGRLHQAAGPEQQEEPACRQAGNYNQKKVQRHLDYIDKKLAEHEHALAQADGDTRPALRQEIAQRKNQRKKYEKIQERLHEIKAATDSENPQLSTSDPDSRHQIVRGTITEVCYTGQTTVDARHKLLIDYKLTNENDKKAMGTMLRRAKSILRTNTFTALYDKGYHTGSEFSTADRLGIKTLVAIPAIGRKSQAPDPAYNAEHFRYDMDADTYTCPQGHRLASNGNRYKARNYTFKQYKTKACKTCPVRSLCTTSKANGKIIQRSQYSQNIQDNATRVAKDQMLYKKRQALVEHPYGTIKRQWGFDHIVTKKGIRVASADFGLMAIAYNLKRLINIIGSVPGPMDLFLAAKKRILMQYGPISGFFRDEKVIAADFAKTIKVIQINGFRLSLAA